MTNFTNTTYCPVNELTNALTLEEETAKTSGVIQNSCTVAFRKRVEGEMKCRTSFRDNETAWVWREGDSFTMGYIGYMDMTFSGLKEANTKYTCVSKNIVNSKYNNGQDQHHMASSLDLEKAMKNAKKYLRAWSPIEIANISFPAFRQEFRKISNNANNEYLEKLNEFVRSFKEKQDVFKEMGYLLDSEYKFRFTTVKALLQDIHSRLDDYKETQNRNPIYKFVFVRERSGEQQACILKVDATNYYISLNTTPDTMTWTPTSDLDDELVRKVSSLSFLKTNDYMDGIGFKAADNCFYVSE